ncbi:SdrD B-like domain-containing protein, partial [Spirosoma panaciterrae]|uniref:SdrD B-like domain-containing protein n=1 Tax=Spirosoma panaciterrae TaxID=496058 RepID=UPI001B7F9D66
MNASNATIWLRARVLSPPWLWTILLIAIGLIEPGLNQARAQTANCPTYRICSGQTATLTTAPGLTNIKWYKDGAVIAGATSATYTTSQPGAYAYAGYNTASACRDSLCCPITLVASTPYQLCLGQSMTLTAATNLTNMKWYRDGTLIAGATSATYSTTQTGTYTYAGDNAATGCRDTLCCPLIVNGCSASLGDYVWLDTNQNGQQDAGETGVASVTAVLYNATTNQPLSTTVTDANGKYLFTNLYPGSYYVKFTAPSGTTFTSANVGNDATDSDAGVGGQTGVYSLTAGQQDLTVDAGLIPLKASLGDYVWLDTNQNGQQDTGETGVASVTVTLYNATTNQPLSTTLTDANGKYLFTNLDPGSYYVKFTAPSGMTFTSANVGNDATDSDAGVGGQTGVYSLTAGQQDLTVDAGLIPLKASLGDYVWLDTNQNGQQDAGETGVASVTAVLYNATTNQPISTTLTDANGKYLFTNLDPGSYYVKFTAPSGMTFTSANVGNDATDSDAGVGGQTGVYSLTAGQQDLTVDAGLIPVQVFDLALVKKLATGQSANVTPGSSVTFTITVYNQGNVDATNVQVTDYIPTGLTLNDGSWTASGGKATLNSLIASLPAGQSTTRNIVFTVGSGVTGSVTNTAEISSASNVPGLPDKDSTPDNDPTNDGTPVNDDTTGDHKNNPSQDEDDSDPEVINVNPAPVFDLALVKKLATGQSANVTPGSSVTFTVTVYNQGNVDATNVQVTDYIPTGLTLNDGSWTASGSKATLNSVIASLPAGQSTTRNIVFTVGSGVTGSVTNTAEISSASNVPGLPDKDSTPDNDPTNDGTPVNDDTTGDHKNNPSQDEDDSDPEVINVTPVAKASLGDYVWLDTNQNGQQDAGETGVASVTAVLYNATTNQPISTTLTDANGKYLFTNLDPGSYYVKFTAPSGMTFTSANVGNDATDSDAGVGGQTGVYSLTAGQQDLTVDAGLIPVSTPCVPASYTLCGAKTSFTLTAGSMYTNVQWYKDGVAIPGATSIDYVATTAGLYSYTATDASGCSTSLCCPISITVCAPVCEKPILSLVNPTCSGNGYYSVSLISSTASLMVSAGQLSGASIINIPIGTPVSVTASNGVGCYNVLTADSPTDCANNGGNNCTPPKLSVGQPLCQGTGFYTVSYRLTGVGSVSSNVGQVNTASRVIENIPVGTNVVVTASGSGTCVTR